MFEILEQFGWWAAIDIALISFFVYQVIMLIRGTRAAQILTGILIVIALFLISSVFPLITLNWVMSKFYSSLIIILVVLFQDDIRHVLSTMGKKPILPSAESISSRQILEEIVKASTTLAPKKIGALIVIERNIILSRYVDIGVQIDGRVSKEILTAIFHPTSPIHDGAVIIQRGRIAAAGCFLPLTKEENLDLHMGTRHRAAIGITQETDAIVVLVSEERACVNLVVGGKVSGKLDANELRAHLSSFFMSDQTKFKVMDGQVPTKPILTRAFERTSALWKGRTPK